MENYSIHPNPLSKEDMMVLFELEPEVAGGLGENTTTTYYDEGKSLERFKILHLHYEFFGWLGDEILECTPCFIITESLAGDIRNSSIKGYALEEAEISLADEFVSQHQNMILPKFVRLIPQGRVHVQGNGFTDWTGDDFCFSQHTTLVVTKEVRDILDQHVINNCSVTALFSNAYEV